MSFVRVRPPNAVDDGRSAVSHADKFDPGSGARKISLNCATTGGSVSSQASPPFQSLHHRSTSQSRKNTLQGLVTDL